MHSTPTYDRLRSFRLGDWLVEPKLGQISCDGLVVRLRPRALEVLATLAAAAGDVVSRRQLIDTVWSAEFVSDNVVSQVITELRRALGDDARRPHYIQNVPRRGYRLLKRATYQERNGRPTPGADVQFVLVAGDTIHALAAGENVIGRSVTADIRIHAPQASRSHARILVEAGRATIEDLGSKNGTLVNGRRISDPLPLTEGDEVQFASPAERFRFGRAGEPTCTAAVTS